MSHQAWLVDLDGTLYRPFGVRAAMALQMLVAGRKEIGVIRTFRRQQELLRTADAESANPFALQIERTASATGRSTKDVEQLVNSWMFVRPRNWLSAFRRRGLLNEIREFHASGGKTALVSDYPASQKLNAMKASHLFDIVVASGEANSPRRLKPHPEGYLLAAKLLGVSPVECLVIGDRPDTDGMAAAAAGMRFRQV